MSEEVRLGRVSAVREKIQELPAYLTLEEKDEILGSLLKVPVVTQEVNVTVNRMNGECRSYLVPAFTSVDALKDMISTSEGIPLRQLDLVNDGQVLSSNTVMGTLVDETVAMPQHDSYDNDDDELGEEIANMPAFGLQSRQVSNESTQSSVDITIVRQARVQITKFTDRAEVSTDGKNVCLRGPATVLLEDCGPGSEVMARLLARGATAAYMGVCAVNADLHQETEMVGSCSVLCTDTEAFASLCRDGDLQALECSRFVCGDIVTLKFAEDGLSFKVRFNGHRIGRFSVDAVANTDRLVISLGGGTGTKWQVLDATTPEMYIIPTGVPLFTHWDMNHCTVDASFKRALFAETRHGTVMLKGCGHGSNVLARVVRKGSGAIYIGVCEKSFALSNVPNTHGAHALLDNGLLIADGNRIGPVFPGFTIGDVLALTVSADGTAFALAKNGAGQIVVNNIPAHPEHVICFGGIDCLWELA